MWSALLSLLSLDSSKSLSDATSPIYTSKLVKSDVTQISSEWNQLVKELDDWRKFGQEFGEVILLNKQSSFIDYQG